MIRENSSAHDSIVAVAPPSAKFSQASPLLEEVEHYKRSLRAANRSDKAVDTYKGPIRQMDGAFSKKGPPAIEDDSACVLYERCEALRLNHPEITHGQIAGRLGPAPSTYKRYVSRIRSALVAEKQRLF